MQLRQYRRRGILSDVRGTPGQLFTATVTYFEGYNESAIGVSIHHAGTMLDTSISIVRQLRVASICQVRVVHPSRAMLGFTHHAPKTAVFEFSVPHDARFPRFERTLTEALTAQNVPYTLHWSKNAGIGHEALLKMYGPDRVARWRSARGRVFNGDPSLMRTFDSPHLERAGLT
jgi:hypothetical protein